MKILINQWALYNIQYRYAPLPASDNNGPSYHCWWVFILKVRPGALAFGQVFLFARGMHGQERALKTITCQIQASGRLLSISTLQSEICHVCPRDLTALGRVTAVEPPSIAQWDRQQRHKLSVSMNLFVPMFGNGCHFLEFACVFQTLELITWVSNNYNIDSANSYGEH